MKRILFVTSLMFAVMSADAQSGSWKVKVNGKVLLSTSLENEKKNIRDLSASVLNNKGAIEVSYKETDPSFWKRSFHFYDEDDNEIISKDSVTYFKTDLATVRRLFAGKKMIRIFTTVTPLDPNIAVRIRRVHLCTLRLP
jgi:hypothetical protein